MSPGRDRAPAPASTGATNHQQNLNQDKGNRYGCPCGCDATRPHDCGVDLPLALVDRTPCTRYCTTRTIAELLAAGAPHGGLCPCNVPAEQRRAS